MEELGLTEETKGFGDLPPIDGFTFTAEQRQAIFKALENYLGYYDPADPNSAVRWAYSQAYSLGLIQAVKLIGESRPILDIIKNKEVFDELAKNGFQLVTDNATKAIVDEIIPAMEALMTNGENPVNVASELNTLFGDQNSDWERLARSEMAIAAETAKIDEWQAWDVQKVEFSPAPDACALCFSVAGDYEIGSAPVPVRDTHPRCRCTIIPAAQ